MRRRVRWDDGKAGRKRPAEAVTARRSVRRGGNEHARPAGGGPGGERVT